MFANRVDAGRQLADVLVKKELANPLIMAIPRGGVVVGAEVARRLKAPLDIVVPRKLGAPYNPEVAVGALAQDGTIILDTYVMDKLGISKDDLKDQIKAEIKEIQRRMKTYRGNEAYPDYSGYNLIVVDDGIATGQTMLAALRSLKEMFQPQLLVLAVPVCPSDMVAQFAMEVEQVVCQIGRASCRERV